VHVIQRTIGELLGDGRLPLAGPADTVADAIKVFDDTGREAVMITDGERVVGIFTERDLLNRVAAAGLQPSRTALSDVMTPEPRVLRAGDAVTFAINRMAVMGFSNIPIVDGLGRPIGILGVRDVLGHLDALFAEDAERTEHDLEDWRDIGGG
jgi:CBS domain-containing protein